MSAVVVLHGVACKRDPIAVPTVGRQRSIVGRFDYVVARLSGDESLIKRAGEGLATGAALAEATAVRLRREGVELQWGGPLLVPDRRDVLALCEERGRSTIEIARSDPSLLTELQLGAWFDATWEVRVVRRLGAIGVRTPASVDLRLAADSAFWRGVRSRASDAEWASWTRTSYVALVYHRLAGERKPGQERIDLAPETFRRQLRFLRRLGFRHLQLEELLALHEAQSPPGLRRAYAVTFDDGLLDCLDPLLKQPEPGIQLFVSTDEVGGRAHWLDNEPLLGWEELLALASAGTSIGSHALRHRPLVGLAAEELYRELVESRLDLEREVALPPILAYPHGAHDDAVRAATVRAGYRAAFTTNKGRNGQGTDRYCLRRVSVHEADGPFAVLWKVVTGEGLPRFWLRARRLRQRVGASRDQL
jgi:peptidoglycan/xylan/chitin deacetylase (PgdA/CDA1 family)